MRGLAAAEGVDTPALSPGPGLPQAGSQGRNRYASVNGYVAGGRRTRPFASRRAPERPGAVAARNLSAPRLAPLPPGDSDERTPPHPARDRPDRHHRRWHRDFGTGPSLPRQCPATALRRPIAPVRDAGAAVGRVARRI